MWDVDYKTVTLPSHWEYIWRIPAVVIIGLLKHPWLLLKNWFLAGNYLEQKCHLFLALVKPHFFVLNFSSWHALASGPKTNEIFPAALDLLCFPYAYSSGWGSQMHCVCVVEEIKHSGKEVIKLSLQHTDLRWCPFDSKPFLEQRVVTWISNWQAWLNLDLLCYI